MQKAFLIFTFKPHSMSNLVNPLLKKQLFFFVLLFNTIFLAGNCVSAQPQVAFVQVMQNLSKPIQIRDPNDGSNRLFIAQQAGQIRILKNGVLQPKPFIDLKNVVKYSTNIGLYSIAFSPDYATSRNFYVLYVSKVLPQTTVLARYKTSATNPDSAILNSGVIVLTAQGGSTSGAHTGDLVFGIDGYLYMTLNDGSFYDNTTSYAQDGTVLFGKMLRINVQNVNTPPYYTIPADNPFVSSPTIRHEIWATGLRNGWRWSFDRLTNDMWLADIGAAQWEEVNFFSPGQSKGANLGWNCYEGGTIFNSTGCGNADSYISPVYAYPHVSATSAEVITGGYVYRGSVYPSLYGYYLCIDYTTGIIYKIKSNGAGGWNAFKQTGGPKNIVSFAETQSGELYAASLLGKIYKIVSLTPVPVNKQKPLAIKISAIAQVNR